MFLMDNTKAMAYINKQKGTISVMLCHLAMKFWNECNSRGIYISAAHIPGIQNVEADVLSWGALSPHEWEMNPIYLHSLFLKLGF